MAETAEKDSREYRVLYRDNATGKWWSHTGSLVTDNPTIAEAWREQATHNGGRSGPTEAVIESRNVTPWTRVIPPTLAAQPSPASPDTEGGAEG